MGEWEEDQIMGKIIIVSFAFFFNDKIEFVCSCRIRWVDFQVRKTEDSSYRRHELEGKLSGKYETRGFEILIV